MSYFKEEHHIPHTWLDAILDLLRLGSKWLVLGHLDGEVDYEIEILNGLVNIILGPDSYCVGVKEAS